MKFLGSLLLVCDSSWLDNRADAYRFKNVPKVGFVLVRPVRPTVLHLNRYDLPVGLNEIQLESRRMYLQITIERAKKVTVDNDRAYPLDLQIQIYNG